MGASPELLAVLDRPDRHGYKATGALRTYATAQPSRLASANVTALAAQCAEAIFEDLDGGPFDHYRRIAEPVRSLIAADLRNRF